MTKRMRAKLVLFFIPMMIVFLLVIPLIHFVRASVGVVLRPPFDDTYRVVSYFDHQSPNYVGDNYIWIYNGERVPSSRANHTGEPYPYDGHDGWDWSMNTGTDILAAAAGTVVVSTGNDNWAVEPCYGRTIVIDHGNSYYTQYSHLSQTLVPEGDPVTVGQHIAESGNTSDPIICPVGGHLHFSVRHGGYDQDIYRYATDPFGWHGQQSDPLINYPAQGQGHTASCLWRSLDSDPISCFDTIVEDAGRGFGIVGTWNESTVGNGYHAYYRGVISGNHNIWASWHVTTAMPGSNKVYAFIPAQNATTRHATYYIYDVSGTWQSKTINQQIYTDEWALLGTYQVSPASAWVYLYIDTQEITSTLSIAADAIKFRSYPAYLPLVLLDPTPTVCVGC